MSISNEKKIPLSLCQFQTYRYNVKSHPLKSSIIYLKDGGEIGKSERETSEAMSVKEERKR